MQNATVSAPQEKTPPLVLAGPDLTGLSAEDANFLTAYWGHKEFPRTYSKLWVTSAAEMSKLLGLKKASAPAEKALQLGRPVTLAGQSCAHCGGPLTCMTRMDVNRGGAYCCAPACTAVETELAALAAEAEKIAKAEAARQRKLADEVERQVCLNNSTARILAKAWAQPVKLDPAALSLVACLALHATLPEMVEDGTFDTLDAASLGATPGLVITAIHIKHEPGAWHAAEDQSRTRYGLLRAPGVVWREADLFVALGNSVNSAQKAKIGATRIWLREVVLSEMLARESGIFGQAEKSAKTYLLLALQEQLNNHALQSVMLAFETAMQLSNEPGRRADALTPGQLALSVRTMMDAALAELEPGFEAPEQQAKLTGAAKAWVALGLPDLNLPPTRPQPNLEEQIQKAFERLDWYKPTSQLHSKAAPFRANNYFQ